MRHCWAIVGLRFSLSGPRQKQWRFWPTTMTAEPCTPSQVRGCVPIRRCASLGVCRCCFKCFSCDQVWIMWAMKTSCHITLQSRFPFNMSCLSASSSTTPPNVNALLPLRLHHTQRFTSAGLDLNLCIFPFYCSSSVHSQRHPEGMAGEEPPLAGAVWCPQGDHGEHPCHRHPLLHGHEGAWIIGQSAWAVLSLSHFCCFFLVCEFII